MLDRATVDRHLEDYRAGRPVLDIRELEQAVLVNDIHTIRCRVVNAGASLLFLGFQCYNMPEPGDSSSPITQAGKVIGLMSSVTLDTCMGIAISSDIIRSLKDKDNEIKDKRNKALLKK
ncbi:hypothetical protein [Methanosarcina sp.]|uniref:hypothetical protein n=1 Tax=Methanosarcina sp. TaxID=2213 RepID=UPI002AB923AA|nr:hypothetical protein [Methanosarcina sp.]MDY9925891.1 hypothetical protein [Methanosarcina sp.]